MSINRTRGTVHDIDPAAVCFPAGHPGREVLIGVCNAPIMFFFVLVFGGVRGRVASRPEVLDELIALGVVAELLEGVEFFASNDPANIFIKPFLVYAT